MPEPRPSRLDGGLAAFLPAVLLMAAAAILTMGCVTGDLRGSAAPSTTSRDSPDPDPGGPSRSPGGPAGGSSDGPSASDSARSPGIPRLPPAAILVVDGIAVQPGMLGSWTFEGAGSDSPWLPATGLSEILLSRGAPITVRLEGDEPIGAWAAWLAPSTDLRGDLLVGVGGRPTASPPLLAVQPGPLPVGRWVLAVRLDFADGSGDATWYWLVNVG